MAAKQEYNPNLDSALPDGRHERPLGELLRELSDETATLVRQEIRLAKAELTQKGKQAGIAAGLLAGALVAALLALGALTAFAILALDGALPNWAAALIVGAVLLGVAAALAFFGRERMRRVGVPVPEQAVESTKEDVRWAKTQLQSGRR
jgi:uncharacterized membrane protein YqjE